ncbi:MAG: hypothetical protein Q9217_007086, partial [Psora testacea]
MSFTDATSRNVATTDLGVWASNTNAFEFLRIYPDDSASKQAFQELLETNLHPHHGQFIVETPRPSSENLTLDYEVELNLRTGYHSIGWHVPSLFGPTRFKIGRGHDLRFGPHRSIDILLVPPTMRNVAPVHLVLLMNRDTGPWIIHANRPVTVGRTRLEQGDQVCLCRPTTQVIINGLVFTFEFMVRTEEQERRYIEIRNQVFEQWEKRPAREIFRSPISGIPLQTDTCLDIAVFGTGVGYGTHACVFEGFEPVKGDLRIIKRVEIKNPDAKKLITEEAHALEQLKGCR